MYFAINPCIEYSEKLETPAIQSYSIDNIRATA